MKKALMFLSSVTLLLAAIALCVFILPANAYAANITASGTCGDNLTWTLDSEGILTISGSGAMIDYDNTARPSWHANKNNIETVIIAEGVTTIGRYAFYDYDILTNVIMNDDVIAIGDYSFFRCWNLVNVTLSKTTTTIGSYAFYDCRNLTDIVLPDSVESIADQAFGDCLNLNYNLYGNGKYLGNSGNPYFALIGVSSLNSISCDIHSNTRIMADYAFSDCSSLKDVIIPNGVTAISSGAFSYCSSLEKIVIPDSVTQIGHSAFRECEKLINVNIPDSVTSLGGYSFCNCSSLTTITIGDNVPIIYWGTFSGCANLNSVTLGNSVSTIEYDVFNGCSQLTSITLSDSITEIDKNAFRKCKITELYIANGATQVTQAMIPSRSTIEKVTIPSSVTTIGSFAFYNCSNLTEVFLSNGLTTISKGAFQDCPKLTDITIPDTVKIIGAWAFSDCKNLTSISIPKSVPVIDDGAFSGCSGITSISMHNGITTIGSMVFEKCNKLQSIYLPDSLTSIGSSAFSNCSSLTSVTVPDSVTSIGAAAFSGCSKLNSITLPFVGGCRQTSSDTTISPFGYIFGSNSYSGGVVTYQRYCNSNNVTRKIYYIPASLKTVTITGGNILQYAFENCSGLISITIPDNSTSIGNAAFSGCTGLTEFSIPQGVTSIGISAFYYCYNMTSVTIPNTVTTIETGAFYQSGLRNIVLPSSVTTIGDFAFYESGLVSITISNENVSIGKDAFSFCSRLTDVCYSGTLQQWNATDNRPDATYVHYATQTLDGHWMAVTVEATCTEAAYTGESCACKYIRNKVLTQDALGHTYVSSVVNPAPGKQGYTLHTCHCGDSYKDNYVAALDLSAPKVSITVDAATGKPALSWANAGEGVTYEIHRATSKSSTYTKVATVATPDWIDTSASVGKTYYYKVKAIYAEDTSLNSDFGAVVSVTAKCATPTLTVKAGSTGKPVLTWNKISDAKKYEIWLSVDGAAFKKLTTTTKTTYTDTKATTGAECIYKVKALGSKSSYNGEFSETGSCYVTCAAPSVTLKLDSKTGKPALSWKKITGAKTYAIYRSANGGEYQLLTTTTAVSYKDSTVQADNKYSYYVITVGKAEVFNSVASATKSVTLAVKAPKLSGSATAEGKPVISWTAAENAVAYEVYRSTKSGKGFELIATVTDLSYTDPTVATGKTFYYKVVAVGTNTESAMSAYLKMVGKCATPTIQVVLDEDSGKPMISWEKIEGAKKYTVYRATSENGKYSKLGTSTKLTYTDSKASVGTKYFYKIVANPSSSSANSNYSNIESCFCICAKAVITAKVDTASGKPTLSWGKVTGAKTYAIYRSENGGEYILVATQTAVSYKDTTAVAGNAYSYQVKVIASKTGADSLPSAEKTVIATCAQPKVKGKVGATGKPELTWGEVESATKYVIYRSTSKSKGFTVLEETEDLSFTDSTAVKGKTYYYKIVALCNETESAQSASAKVKSK